MRLVLDARTAAFAALVDYAGLFPPASLSVSDAVTEYTRHRSDDNAWVVGRFLCRASQLSELAAVATSTFERGEAVWSVGVIFDLPAGESAALAIDFQSEMDPAISISAAEAKLAEPTTVSVADLLEAMMSVAPEVVPFVEVDPSSSIPTQIELVARALETRRRVGGAKFRCGGATVDQFPTAREVAEFLIAVTNHRLPFKATAGLHQPIRHFDADLGIERHGFINVLMAAAIAESGSGIDTIEAVIADSDPDSFSISTAFATWREHEVPGSALRRVRRSGFVAYGSCDFDEPIDALEQLGFLGEGA